MLLLKYGNYAIMSANVKAGQLGMLPGLQKSS